MQIKNFETKSSRNIDLLQSISIRILADQLLRGFREKTCDCGTCDSNTQILIMTSIINTVSTFFSVSPFAQDISKHIQSSVYSSMNLNSCTNINYLLKYGTKASIFHFTKLLKNRLMCKAKNNSKKETTYRHYKLRIMKN